MFLQLHKEEFNLCIGKFNIIHCVLLACNFIKNIKNKESEHILSCVMKIDFISSEVAVDASGFKVFIWWFFLKVNAWKYINMWQVKYDDIMSGTYTHLPMFW